MKSSRVLWFAICAVIAFAMIVSVSNLDRSGQEGKTMGRVYQEPSLEKKVEEVQSENLVGKEELKPVEFSLKEDHDDLIRRTSRGRKDHGGYQFAEAISTMLTPENSGIWDEDGEGNFRWRLRLKAPGALSLNFGYSSYEMPIGGTLSLSEPGKESPYRNFTEQDNEEHGQLWTPVLESDDVLITVTLPNEELAEELKLELASVNYGFRSWKDKSIKIGGATSGACNVDVTCSASEIGSVMIDLFQDQIRSVGAYTLGGVDTCSGALVNNTAQDNTPYENSLCRAPGSSQSGSVGNGNLTMFNSGAIFRADSSASDFTLVELDDPVDSAADVFLAGWDRSGVQATTTVGIHHPAVAEKRISFDFDDATVTSYYGTASPGAGTHFRVADWDIGTTEGGSSGSPLFDQNGRIIGQLHGGDAACGNDASDWYGRLFVSWTGGGASATRLSDWLDPANTGSLVIDGKDYNGVAISISDASVSEGDSGGQILEYTVSLSEVSNSVITLSYSTQNGSASAGSDYVAMSGGLNFPAGVTIQTVLVTVNGDAIAEENETVLVNLTGNPTGTTLIDSEGVGTIYNDDFITPVINSSLTASSVVGSRFDYQITALNTPTSFHVSSTPAGMSVDSATGLVSWVPSSAGVFTVDLSASNEAGSDVETLTITVAGGSLRDGPELDQWPSVVLTQSGNANWFDQTVTTHDGSDAGQAGDVNDNEFSEFSLSVYGPGSVSFWWQVSSEANYDYLRFYEDGVVIQEISGTTGWVQVTQNFDAGEHLLKWSYEKDFSISEAQDTGYVDELTLTGYAGWIASHTVGIQTAFDDNIEGDAFSNLLEYGYDLDPDQRSEECIPELISLTNGRYQMKFPKNPGATGLIYGAEVSQDMAAWSSANMVIVSDSPTEQTVEENSNNAPSDKLFFRGTVRIEP